jgi:hypothetical protein
LSQLRFGFGGIYVSITCACVRCGACTLWCRDVVIKLKVYSYCGYSSIQ